MGALRIRPAETKLMVYKRRATGKIYRSHALFDIPREIMKMNLENIFSKELLRNPRIVAGPF